MRNLGNQAWFAGSNHELKVNFDACGLFASSTYPIEGNEVTFSNENRVFTILLQVPPAEGSCAFGFQMTGSAGTRDE